MRDWGALELPLSDEPDEVPPQRGVIDPRHAWHLKTVLQMAETLGTKLLRITDPLNVDIDRTTEREERARNAIASMAKGGQLQLGEFAPQVFADLVMAELFGYGPIERFLNRPEISEVMVNGPYVIYIERAGKLVETGHKFLDDAHVERVIRRIVRPLGRDVGANNPLVDARLPDGSRVNVAVPPCTLDGPSITIRKFGRHKMALGDMVDRGSLSPEMARFLAAIVKARQNIVVSGGTGSGKTTLINALSQFIPEGERVVTIEDAAELRLLQRNVVRLESKKASIDNPIAVSIRDCVVNALRMRPERILVGECRNAEALDMLQAMNTGHDGSMTTLHANTPRDAISRLETLALMAGLDLPVLVIRKQIVSAIQYIVQVSRLRDGSRKITHVTEVQRMEGDVVILSDVFVFKETGTGTDGSVLGVHVPTGNRPRCMDALARQGIDLPQNLFMVRHVQEATDDPPTMRIRPSLPGLRGRR
ncbi:MAG: CpaF family protein [Myxococcota bacterium]